MPNSSSPALFRDTPWPSRESLYLHREHSSCRFATVSPGGLTVEIRFLPEELRWCPGISRCCFATQCVPVSPGGLKIFETTGATSRRIPIQCGACRHRYSVVPVGPHRSDAWTKTRGSVDEAYKLDLSTLFTFFLWTSLPFILWYSYGSIAPYHHYGSIYILFLNVEINI